MRFEDILKTQRPMKFWPAIGVTIGLLFSIIIVTFIMGFILSLIIGIISGLFSLDIDPNKPIIGFQNEMLYAIIFIFVLFGSILTTCTLIRKKIDKLPILTLLTAKNKFRFRLFFFGLIIGAFILFLDMLVSSFSEEENPFLSIIKRFNDLGAMHWLILLITYSIVISVQAGTEEVLFRGQLLQWLRRANLPLIFCVIISNIFFGIAHYQHNISLAIIFITFSMGLAFSYITIRTQGIEFSMGGHIVNNIICFAIFGYMDNSAVQDSDFWGGFIYLFLYIGLFELGLRLFPNLLEASSKD